MELVEVYIGRKFGYLRFKPWYRAEISDEFGVKPKYYDCVDIWHHEFSEESIWHALHETIEIPKTLLNSQTILLSLPNGKTIYQTPSHVIVSLQDLSYFQGSMIKPDSYAKMLKWRRNSKEH